MTLLEATVEHEAISTNKANPPAGPYNQGIKWNNLVFTASVATRHPTFGVAPEGDVGVAARNALENLKAILEAAGSDLNHVLKVTLYINDMEDFAEINEVYATYFTGIRPARSLVRVGGPRGSCSFDAIGFVPNAE
jgi:2-iminobutanoate/2-iminopropanoate deaminase